MNSIYSKCVSNLLRTLSVAYFPVRFTLRHNLFITLGKVTSNISVFVSESTPASSSDRRNVKISGLDQYVRGQWRASSDGVVKKYGRHGNYMKSSPLSTM